MSRVFRPNTETQKDVKQSLLGELKTIKENLKELPTITFPQLQAIAAPPEDEEDEDEDVMRVGKIAHQYLSDYAAKQNVDKTFGIYTNPIDKQYYIGNKPIDIQENNLVIGDKEYEGTPGLWERIISKKPDQNIYRYSQQDFDNYAKILVETNVSKQNNNPAEVAPKSSRGWKWRKLLSTIRKDRSQYEGEGMGENLSVIPSDPDALIDRLNLLLASKAAGNTGVRNELITICDELLRQKVMSKPAYKKINVAYIKCYKLIFED